MICILLIFSSLSIQATKEYSPSRNSSQLRSIFLTDVTHDNKDDSDDGIDLTLKTIAILYIVLITPIVPNTLVYWLLVFVINFLHCKIIYAS